MGFRVTLLAIGLSWIGAVSVLADGPSCTDCTTSVQSFDDIESALKADFNSATQCQSFDGQSGSVGCDFASMCRTFSANADSPYLYENAQGGKIPNYALSNVSSELASCLADKENLFDAKNQIEREKEYQGRVREAGLHSLHLQQAFFASIKAHHEQDAYVDISNAEITRQIENAKEKKGSTRLMVYGFSMVSGDVIHQLEQDEKIAGKKYSEATQKAYVAMMTDDGMEEALNQEMRASQARLPWKSLNRDPFLDLSFFSNSKVAGSKDQVMKNQAELQAEIDRIYGIFKSTQGEIVQYLDQQRTPENSAAIEDMKARIMSIRMNTRQESILSPYSCPGPNAFYNPDDHQFHICPQIMELPDESLRMIIAHELSHSMDPCSLSDDLLKIDGKTLGGDSSMAFMGIDENKLEQQAEKQGIYAFHLKDPQPKSNDHYAVDELGLTRPQLANQYIDPQTTVVAAGIPYSSDPFATTLACLQDTASIGARGPSPAVLSKALDQAISKWKLAGATPQNTPAYAQAIQARAHVQDLVRDHGGCSFIPGQGGNTQLQEAFADKIATEVLARDLANQSAARKQQGVFEAAGFFLAMSCPNVAQAAKLKMAAVKNAQGCLGEKNKSLNELSSIFEAQQEESDEHPWSVDRINRLLLAQPSLRQDLGCGASSSQARYCP